MAVPTADRKTATDAHAFHSGVAIFDLDRTLIPGSSLMVLARELVRRRIVQRSQLLRQASDVPLLSACGRPVAVNPDRRLRAAARANGWPVIELS